MTRRRRREAGAVEQLPSGRWRVRVRVDGRRRTLGTFDDREEAERVLQAYLAEVGAARIVEPRRLTLAQLGEQWLDQREIEGSALRDRVRSIHEERSVWRRHVASSELAALPLVAVEVRDVERFARRLRRREAVAAIRTSGGTVLRPTGRTISAQLQRHALRLVRQCFDEAVRRGVIHTNPAKLVRAPRGERSVDDVEDWLRADEIERLLTCGELSLRDRTAYACAIGLGLRLGDLKSLRVDQVHLEGRSPHVLARVHKSERWHRVPVLPWLQPWLGAHLAGLSGRWVFPNRDGDRYASGRFNFHWSPKRYRVKGETRVRAGALELAGIERRIRFHDLRGTCATHLAIGTWGRAWTLTEVQQFLAHADQRTTERYVRRALDSLGAAAAATRAGPQARPERVVDPRVTHDRAQIAGNTGRTSRLRSQRSQVRILQGPLDLRDPAWVNVGQRAREILLLAAAGQPVPESLVDELVNAVLAQDLVQLALEVRAGGGEYRPRRVIELAELLASALGSERDREADDDG